MTTFHKDSGFNRLTLKKSIVESFKFTGAVVASFVFVFNI